MADFDLIIKGGRVYLPDGPKDGLNIGIRENLIATLSTDSIAGKEEINAEGYCVIPGAIDPHMHCWRGSDFENIGNASRAAAKGGVTTIIDMPIDRPIPSTPKILKGKIAECERESFVDFALYGGVGFEGLTELPRILEEPVVGIKLFMDTTPPLGKYPGLDTGQLYDALSMIGRSAKLASIHCEDTFIIDHLSRKIQAIGRRDPLSFAESRPPFSEYMGIMKALCLVEHTGCRSVIAHVSIPEGIKAIKRARSYGVPVYAETAPHYLLLTLDDLSRDVRLKFKPPNRDKEQVQLLWKHLRDGDIQLIGSDHAPLHKDTNLDIWEINGGVGNMVELMLPLIATEGSKRHGMDLTQFVGIMCENPARIFGLYPRKGCIRVGSDADLVLLNLESSYTIRIQDLSMVVPPYSPFENWKISIRPETVILGGCPIVLNSEPLKEPPKGKFIPVGKMI